METKVIKLDVAAVDSARISEAAAMVDAGALVAFPTETVYGIACRVQSESLARLDQLKSRSTDKHYTLHIAEKDGVHKYVPKVGLKAGKLIEKAWPGPLTMVFEFGQEQVENLKDRVGADAFECLYKDNSIGIRCPDNMVAQALLSRAVYPVVAPSANIKGEPAATDSDQVLAQLTDKIELLLDAGPCKYKDNSTVVNIGNKGLEILRPGVYSLEELEELSEIRFLFVCTGNTCRSPMAEGIFRKYLAEKLQCDVDALAGRGYKISSAGIIGSSGFPASAEAVKACALEGVDIEAHRNKGLSRELIEGSDFIFAMENVHRNRIVGLDPRAAGKCSLLAGTEGVPDPIGQPQQYYDDCAKLIKSAVRERIGELVI